MKTEVTFIPDKNPLLKTGSLRGSILLTVNDPKLGVLGIESAGCLVSYKNGVLRITPAKVKTTNRAIPLTKITPDLENCLLNLIAKSSLMDLFPPDAAGGNLADLEPEIVDTTDITVPV